MNKDLVEKMLGADFGIVQKVELDNGNVIKVKNDDWGCFVYLVNPDGEVLYSSSLIVYYCDVVEEIEYIKSFY